MSEHISNANVERQSAETDSGSVQEQAERTLSLESSLDRAATTERQHKRIRARKMTTLLAGALVALSMGSSGEAGDKKGGGIGGWLKKNADTILVGGVSALDATRYGGDPLEAARRGVGTILEEKNRRKEWEARQQADMAQGDVYRLEQQIEQARQRQEQTARRLQEIDTEYRSARNGALSIAGKVKNNGLGMWQALNAVQKAQITLWQHEYDPDLVSAEDLQTAQAMTPMVEEQLIATGKINDPSVQALNTVFFNTLIPLAVERESLRRESELLDQALNAGDEARQTRLAQWQAHAMAAQRASRAANIGARLSWY